jgi:hypothetical protein
MALTPDECLLYLKEYKGERPDFIQNNGTWLLTVVGVTIGCFGTMFTYFLKSRCKKLKLCCLECDRTPVDLEAKDVTLEAKEID